MVKVTFAFIFRALVSLVSFLNHSQATRATDKNRERKRTRKRKRIKEGTGITQTARRTLLNCVAQP